MHLLESVQRIGDLFKSPSSEKILLTTASSEDNINRTASIKSETDMTLVVLLRQERAALTMSLTLGSVALESLRS